MSNIISLILNFFTVPSFASEDLPYLFEPVIEIDASGSEGEVSSRAMGCLYGLAEFNGRDSYAPHIYSVTVNAVSGDVNG